MNLVALVTMLCVRDVERSTAWYRDRLGFEVVESDPGINLLRLGSHRLYVFAESPPTEDKPSVHLEPPASPERGSIILVLMVEDCIAAYEELTSRGVEFLTPPMEPSWGGRRCFAHDPDGYLIEVEDWAGSRLSA